MKDEAKNAITNCQCSEKRYFKFQNSIFGIQYSIFFIFFFILHPSSLLFSQSMRDSSVAVQWNYSVDDTTLCIELNSFLPPFLRDELLLKKYIRDEKFLQLRLHYTDTVAVDAMYLRALAIAEGNIGHALFIAMLATMDHFRLGIKVPLLGTLRVPLTTETLEEFRIRRSHLPRRVLPDSIGKKRNDKDKLQHFFGSALLAYDENSKQLTTFIGNQMEIIEDAIVVGGENDVRDKLANALGRDFGLRLLNGDDVLPSEVLWQTDEKGK